jgi:GrpB-like predicted nucleotidyltransferase (UPF0157 family)
VPAQPIVIRDHQPGWPTRFRSVAQDLRARLGDAALRIDHIGSTAVPGLAAKDLIDVQVTVARLGKTDDWPDELLPGLVRRDEITSDHVPPGGPDDPQQWAKRYWSNRTDLHVHVREHGLPNQRYALLFRDYLRSDAAAAGAYGALKRALADVVAGDWDSYYAVKDPACDLILAGAEQWAAMTHWAPSPPDA